MIDETNDIEIVVYCRGNSIDKIVINGKEDYFIYMKSQIEASKYQLIPTTEFEVQSPEIQNLRENLWDSNVYLGERESIVNSYYQYFDRQICRQSRVPPPQSSSGAAHTDQALAEWAVRHHRRNRKDGYSA